jgi:hypothetical protein
MRQQQQLDMFDDGGLRDQGGSKDPVSGNDVPVGAMQKEVRDDIPAQLSEGEFIFPADVVRYWGLDLLMQMRQEAKQGLQRMDDMGQMGNSEEATLPDDMPFDMADIETEDKPAFKFNVGGLAADPRFANQATTVPTYSEEDKQKITDTVLSGVFGDITMKRYVNAEGKVMYIPFIGDKPQAPIPEGFTLDESPVVSSPSAAGAVSTDRGEDRGSAFDPTSSVLDRLLQQPEMPQVKSVDINKMSPEELIAYYESFTSPMARFASYGAGILFGPLVGAGLALAQQWSIRNGPNSFINTEKKLAELISNGTIKDAGLMKRITDARKLAKTNGVGPVSLLSKIGEKLGLSKGPDTDILTQDLSNAIKNGVLPKNAEKILKSTDAITEAFKDIDPETKKLIDKYTGGRGVPGESMLYGKRFDPKDIGTDPSITPARVEPASGLQTKTEEGDPYKPVEPSSPVTNFNYGDQPEYDTAFSSPVVSANTAETPAVDVGFQETFRKQKESAEDALERLKPGTRNIQTIKRRSKEDEALVADQSIPDFFGGPQEGLENFGSSDEDRQGGGVSSEAPSLGGSPFDNTAPPSPTRTTTNYGYTPTTRDPYEASQDMGAFFKKGGLAKSKAKPKRMKKGGLASKKK